MDPVSFPQSLSLLSAAFLFSSLGIRVFFALAVVGTFCPPPTFSFFFLPTLASFWIIWVTLFFLPLKLNFLEFCFCVPWFPDYLLPDSTYPCSKEPCLLFTVHVPGGYLLWEIIFTFYSQWKLTTFCIKLALLPRLCFSEDWYKHTLYFDSHPIHSHPSSRPRPPALSHSIPNKFVSSCLFIYSINPS